MMILAWLGIKYLIENTINELVHKIFEAGVFNLTSSAD
jgi:hypothetical protein